MDTIGKLAGVDEEESKDSKKPMAGGEMNGLADLLGVPEEKREKFRAMFAAAVDDCMSE